MSVQKGGAGDYRYRHVRLFICYLVNLRSIRCSIRSKQIEFRYVLLHLFYSWNRIGIADGNGSNAESAVRIIGMGIDESIVKNGRV